MLLSYVINTIELPPSFHKQSSVSDAKTQVACPFSSNTRISIQNWKYGSHLWNIKQNDNVELLALHFGDIFI